MQFQRLTFVAVALFFGGCFIGGCTSESSNGSNSDTGSSSEISPQQDSLIVEGDLTASELDSFRIRRAFQSSAKNFNEAFRNGNFDEFLNYLHPSIVAANGGRSSFKNRLKEIYNANDTARYRQTLIGPVSQMIGVRDPKGNLTGWYCTMPVRRWLKGAPEQEFQLQWLGGQTLNAGKNCYFIDITQIEKEKIYQIMPDFRYLLENQTR